MENIFGNHQTFRHLSSRPLLSPEIQDGRLHRHPHGGDHHHPLGPQPPTQTPFSDQFFGGTISRLNLTSPPLPADLYVDFGGSVSLDAAAMEGFSPLSSSRLNANKFQNGFGGGTHMNQTVGVFRTGSYPTATSERWLRGGDDDFDGESDGFYLRRKKQLGNQLTINHHFEELNLNPIVSRANRLPLCLDRLSLGDLRGKIVFSAKDQFGCKLLQEKLEDSSEEEIEMVLLEVIDHLGELMRDQFGNCLIQKIVKMCNEKQRIRIILSMTKSRFQLISICLNPHGTRAVQRLLENVSSHQEISLVMSALTPGAVALVTDPNGHHVIQYCLTHFSKEDNKYLLKEIADDCFKIATSKSGCCVLPSCLEHSQGEFREQIVAEIIANALHLAEDRFGNYVVQHVLLMRIPEVTENLLRQFEGSYLSLSCNKYASNVVEKCLTESGEEKSSQIIMELLRSPNACMLLVNPFGNFVIQSALSVSRGFIRKVLLNLVRVNAPSLRTNLYGKKVLEHYDKLKLQRV